MCILFVLVYRVDARESGGQNYAYMAYVFPGVFTARVNYFSFFFFSVLPPLGNLAGTKTDHGVLYATAYLTRQRTFQWISYSYLQYTEDGCRKFRDWLESKDWSGMSIATDSSSKAEIYNRECLNAMKSFFPTITTRRKSSDDPWINDKIRKMVEKSRLAFKREGRSETWKKLKKRTRRLIKRRRKAFYDKQGAPLFNSKDSRRFFKNVRSFKDAEKPVEWSIDLLCPGKSDKELAIELAGYFNKRSDEFENLKEPPRPSWMPDLWILLCSHLFEVNNDIF